MFSARSIQFSMQALVFVGCLIGSLVSHATSCVWEGGSLGNNECAPIDCIEAGGLAECTEPEPLPRGGWQFIDRTGEGYWQYRTCDEYVPYMYRMVAWCRAAGGVWGGGGCESLPADAYSANVFREPTRLGEIAHDFIGRIHKDAFECGTDVTVNDWGAEADNRICFHSVPKYVSGIHVADHASIRYDGVKSKENNECGVEFYDQVFFSMVRDVACPLGFETKTKPNGDLHCYKPPENICPVGNPSSPLSGAKTKQVSDFAGSGAVNLQWTRHYNSHAAMRGDRSAAQPMGSRYWRHGYDRRLMLLDGSDFVSAIALRPDGTMRHFDLDGNEVVNRDGAGWQIQPHQDGWLLSDGKREREFYDADLRLTRIETTGERPVHLVYDDAGLLTRVEDDFGRAILLDYNEDGWVQRVHFPDSSWAEYAYGRHGQLESVHHVDDSERRYHYEGDHPYLLTAISNELGLRELEYQYDSHGRVVESNKGGGENRYQFSYASNGTQSTVTDPLGAARTYRFASQAGVMKLTDLTQPCTNCGSSAKQTEYDEHGNVVRKVDFDGRTTRYVYDTERNLEIRRIEADGTPEAHTIHTEWHPSLRLPVRIRRPSGLPGVEHVTEMAYTDDGQVSRRTETAGDLSREWQYQYDAAGRLASVTDPANAITHYSYYADDAACFGCRGQLKRITNALGHDTHYSDYDAAGRQREVIDANGVLTRIEYNNRGWVSQLSRSVDGVIVEQIDMHYDASGQLLSVEQAGGPTLHYQYDTAGRLIAIQDGGGNRIDYALDAAGNRVNEVVSDAEGNIVRSRGKQFDVLGRVAESIGGQGERTRLDYDAGDSPLAQLDPLQRLHLSEYDALGRLRRQLDPIGGETQFDYNDADQITAVTDATGLSTEYRYDGFGRLIELDSPDTGLTSYSYDALDNLRSRTDARGVTLTRQYDLLGRVLQESAAGLSINYSYDTDRLGVLRSVSDGSGEQLYSHDALGRLTHWQQNIDLPGANASLNTQWSYSDGRPASMTYPSGRVLAWQYDAHGKPVGLTLDGWPVLEGIEYQPFGGPVAWDWGSGQSLQRVFDRNGRMVRQTVEGVSNAPGPWRETYGYDAMDRLAHAELRDDSTRRYHYDAIGNRTELWRDTVVEHYRYALDSHRLIERSGPELINKQYDAVGNLINDGRYQYHYNAFNRLVGVDGQGTNASYAHNHHGQRVYKNVNGQITLFAYDQAGRLIGEYSADGSPIREILWLGDTPVAVVADGTIYPIIADHLNTPRQIINPQGELVWQWQSTPFGVGEADSDPRGTGETFAFNLRFPGQYFDTETGLHYNYFRDYDPRTGRYVQSDPIGLGDGPSTYGYVQGNPLGWIDPFGLTRTRMDCDVELVPRQEFITWTGETVHTGGFSRRWVNCREVELPPEPTPRDCEEEECSCWWRCMYANGLPREVNFAAAAAGTGAALGGSVVGKGAVTLSAGPVVIIGCAAFATGAGAYATGTGIYCTSQCFTSSRY